MSVIQVKLAAVLALCVPAAWAQRAPAPRSPEVAPDRTVTFRLAAPAAHEVTLTGEFMKGSKPLTKDADGVWSVTAGPIEPEIYYYNFTIDGVKTIDPGNPDVKTGSTPSTISSVLEVKAAQPAFYDGQPVAHGEIHTDWYQSKTLGALRRLTVYTPPGYDNNVARYPVLYLFHGANADETAWTRLGHVNLILDNLLAAHKAAPFLVVMPFGYGIPPGTPRPVGASGPNSDELFASDLIADVVPFVQSHYRADTDRERRGIVGLSMGGGQSLSIGLNHLDLFAWVGGFSAGLRPADFAKTFAATAADPQAANAKLRLLWIGCGRDDGAMVNSKAFDEFLNQHNVRHTFHESDGAHTWIVWRRYLNEVAPLLFAGQPQTPPGAEAALSGKGLAQHPFLYCGEWQNRSISNQLMYIVRNGKIAWSYLNPLKGELGDCSMLSNGNILFSRQFGASEVTPEQKIVWNYDAPPGTEIHTTWPVDKDRVLIMQNGNPAKAMVINKITNRVEKELVLPTRVPTSTHGQFRHVRMTPEGNFLVAHLDLGKVVEYSPDGKELWSVPAPSAWAAVRLKNGNTLISGNQRGWVREVNPKGETVWEINKDDLPGIPLYTVQECSRLANGNTLINNWAGSSPSMADWPKIAQVIEVTPDKRVVWALRDWTTLGPASSTQLLDEPGVAEQRELQR
jgi:enterochelin esterase-like enzyme